MLVQVRSGYFRKFQDMSC